MDRPSRSEVLRESAGYLRDLAADLEAERQALTDEARRLCARAERLRFEAKMVRQAAVVRRSGKVDS